MKHPFKNYALGPDEVLIHPKFVAEVKAFNSHVTAIIASITEHLADEECLERLVSGKNNLVITQPLNEINELEYISVSTALLHIAKAMIACFEEAIAYSDDMRCNPPPVRVNLVISEDNPTKAELILSVVSKTKKD